jgi:hypothetical protein
MENAYTIGRTTSYDEALATDEPEKVGKNDGYDGGVVWKTAQEARDFLNSGRKFGMLKFADIKDYSVYELELKNNWNIDVTDYTIEDTYRLLNNAKIVKKVNI